MTWPQQADNLSLKNLTDMENGMLYDPANIFAKIIRGEIPCRKIMENDYAVAFHDVNPKAPIHALIIPKGPYLNSGDFYSRARDEEVIGFYRLMAQVIDQLQIKENGYRLISNCGDDGGQEVPHFHIHILAGCIMGPLVNNIQS